MLLTYDLTSVDQSTVNQDEEIYLATSKFESNDDLLKSVRAFYYGKGYGLSIRDSKKEQYVTLQCDLSGVYQDKRRAGTKRKKSTGSRLTDCPFQIKGKKGSDGVWIFKVKNLEHNHDPSTDMSGHPSFRRLEPEDVQTVKTMSLSGIPPRQILSTLRQQKPNLPAISRTIYNLKAKFRKDDLGNRSTISLLFEELEKGGFSHDILHNPEGYITGLFIAHPLSIQLAKTFSNTFVMDCTYKTNRYNMPLLDIIGVTCFNTSFYSGFVFLDKEDKDHYVWALSVFKKILGDDNLPSVIMSDRELALMNAITDEFPTTKGLLCVWHIEKNVLSNCKGYFECAEEFDMFMSSWNDLVYSTTESLFEKNWKEFQLCYSGKKDAIEYINDTWLPWKEKFVSAWTEKYSHFGNRSSSRAEGAHAKLKLYLGVSTGSFQDVKRKISLAVEHEFNEIKVNLASEKIRVPHNCNKALFRELLSHVSQFALKKIHEQYEKIKDGTVTSCTGHFMATMGLPCAHKIINCLGKTISLDIIHPHWRIDTLSLNPEVDSSNDSNNDFFMLLNELRSKYQLWPLSKQELATSMIAKLVNETDTYFEPVIRRPKGRPPKAKKKKGKTSTTRDPSKFELVESSHTHNPSSSRHMQHHNNLIDLNAYPECPGDFS